MSETTNGIGSNEALGVIVRPINSMEKFIQGKIPSNNTYCYALV